MKRRPLLAMLTALALLASSVVATGCGGKSGGSTTSGKHETKAHY